MNAQCGALHPKVFRKELRKYYTKETVGIVHKIIILPRTPDITYLSYTLPKLGKNVTYTQMFKYSLQNHFLEEERSLFNYSYTNGSTKPLFDDTHAIR